MDADWSVELGHDDPCLEFPWSSPDGSRRYVDLLQSPELLSQVSEARQYPDLAESLIALNGPASSWQTAKCDAWLDKELEEADQIYAGKLKFCSYLDLVARDTPARFLFERHERFVKSAAQQLSDDNDQPVACEFIVRRCWYHAETSSSDLMPGFYVTLYVFGYGNDEAQAHRHWAEGIRRATVVVTGSAP